MEKCVLCGAEHSKESGKIALTYKGYVCINHRKSCDLCGVEYPLIHMIDTGEYQYCNNFCRRMHENELKSY